MTKKVLMIAYHFPPIKGSSGIQRTLSFARYLPQHGWTPIILSAHPRAYRATSPEQLNDITQEMIVHRAFALDTSRHLALKGRYFRFMALPDSWVSWWLGGVISGLRLIKRHRPQLIWSTYPIATAHMIGLSLQKLTGIPWVADFRDSMTEASYPSDPTVRKVYQSIERGTIRRCKYAVFTAPGAVSMYQQRYPEIARDTFQLIENGYDNALFDQAISALTPLTEAEKRPVKILHSGIIYPSERDPSAFFDALQQLKRNQQIRASEVQIVLRASGFVEQYQAMLAQRDLQDIVQLAPMLPYNEALAEMLQADALMILQAASCNHQIPAKLYEYLKAKRPILALTDPKGDTAWVLKKAGMNSIAPLDSVEQIRTLLPGFIQSLQTYSAVLPDEQEINSASRENRTYLLSQLLNATASDLTTA